MVLKISIDSDTEARLKKLADGAGKDVAEFVAELVEQAAAKPFLDEILAPLRAQFADSSTGDKQLVDEITVAQKNYRADESKKSA
jgi:hypothetical protein